MILAGILFACSDNTNKNNDEKIIGKEAIELVKYVDRSIGEKDPDCGASPENCAEVIINFPEITGVPATLKGESLNADIQKAILNGSLDPEGEVEDVEKACKKFINDFAEFKKEMQQEVAGWTINIDIKIINNDGNYFSLRIDENAYLGGAHPNQYTSFLNYNITTGEKITLDMLIKDMDRLETVAEQKFRKAKDLSSNEDLGEAGYFFDKGKFTLTENFGISQGNLVLYYNSYDIAPYALGPTLLELPLETVL